MSQINYFLNICEYIKILNYLSILMQNIDFLNKLYILLFIQINIISLLKGFYSYLKYNSFKARFQIFIFYKLIICVFIINIGWHKKANNAACISPKIQLSLICHNPHLGHLPFNLQSEVAI